MNAKSNLCHLTNLVTLWFGFVFIIVLSSWFGKTWQDSSLMQPYFGSIIMLDWTARVDIALIGDVCRVVFGALVCEALDLDHFKQTLNGSRVYASM